MTRVLVTGATGYIGAHLVKRLVMDDVAVRCLVRKSSKLDDLPRDQIELSYASLLDSESLRSALANCDVVFHLAGLTSAIRRRDLYQVNARGSFALAQACARQKSPPRLVVVSSLAAAGTAIAGRIRAVSDPDYPISDYGRSKRAGELAAVAWSDQVPTSIVRPGIVFGGGNRELYRVFGSIAKFHLHAVPGYTPRRVAMIHHDDLIELLLRVQASGTLVCRRAEACQSGARPGYYFAADTQVPTYPELGRMIARAVKASPLLILPISEPVAWLLAGGNQWMNACLGRTDNFNVDKIREAFAGDWVGAVEATNRQLQFHPACSLQERLDQTAHWYKSHGWI